MVLISKMASICSPHRSTAENTDLNAITLHTTPRVKKYLLRIYSLLDIQKMTYSYQFKFFDERCSKFEFLVEFIVLHYLFLFIYIYGRLWSLQFSVNGPHALCGRKLTTNKNIQFKDNQIKYSNHVAAWKSRDCDVTRIRSIVVVR